MTNRNVIKAAAGMEDLLTGVGTATQTRGGIAMPITKIDVAFAVTTVEAMQALDVAKYTRARVYISESNVAEYLYDSADNSGISSDTGSGTWVAAPVAARVLAVSDKATMQTTEPVVNRQLAVALGATALGVGYGGVYWYDNTDTTSPDDGDLVLVTGGGARWKRVLIEADQLEQIKDAAGSANGLTASFGMLVVPETKIIWLRAIHTNSGAVTLNVDGSGALPVQYADGSALTAGAIESTKVYGFIRVGSTYKIMNPSVSAVAVAAGTDNHGMLTALRLSAYLSAYLSPYWTNLGQAMVDIGVLQTAVSGFATDLVDLAERNYDSIVQPFVRVWKTSGSGTWSIPTGVTAFTIYVGGGNGGNGGTPTDSTVTYNGVTYTGQAGANGTVGSATPTGGTGGAGGGATNGDYNITGQSGLSAENGANSRGGFAGTRAIFGGNAAKGTDGNFGIGGRGGGGVGGMCIKRIVVVDGETEATYSVGAGGTGADGGLVVFEY